MHRDVKPDNICLNPHLGIASLLDFGCMMRTDGSDYSRGGSPNYVPTELAVPEVYLVEDRRRAATFSSSDTFLGARVIYEMMLSMPVALDLNNYDPDDAVSFASYLSATRSFDWTPGLEFLQSNGLAPAAQWLVACLEPDPLLRPTPQQALALPFVAAVADEVDVAIAAAMPSFLGFNHAAVQLLQSLQGQVSICVAHQQQVPSSSNGSSNSSRSASSTVAASHGAQLARLCKQLTMCRKMLCVAAAGAGAAVLHVAAQHQMQPLYTAYTKVMQVAAALVPKQRQAAAVVGRRRSI
jgi:serine/threonine protein kinase